MRFATALGHPLSSCLDIMLPERGCQTHAKCCPTQAWIPRLLVEHEQIKSLYALPLSRLLDGCVQHRANSLATKLRAHKHSAEPGSQFFASLKIMHSKRVAAWERDLLPFEILHSFFVFLGCAFGFECAKVPASSGLRILLARIQPVAALNFSDHALSPSYFVPKQRSDCNEDAKPSMARTRVFI
jgi:hypothetical protein